MLQLSREQTTWNRVATGAFIADCRLHDTGRPEIYRADEGHADGVQKAPPERGFGLHAVMTAVHLVMVAPAMHGHRLARGASVHAAAGRRLARSRTARLRASAGRTGGGLCNCERAGQSEGRGQYHCRDLHGRSSRFVSPEKKSSQVK